MYIIISDPRHRVLKSHRSKMGIIYIYIYINIYIYIYICNHENNVPSRLLPQWLCGNHALGTWVHDVQMCPRA